jgi:hypothetical protein
MRLDRAVAIKVLPAALADGHTLADRVISGALPIDHADLRD